MNEHGRPIDAHQHFWRLARGDYGWLHAGLAPLYRDCLPPDLAPLLASTGVGRTVLVQAAPTRAETEFLLELARRTPFVAGVVGWIDMQARGAPAELEALARDERFLGLRPMLQDLHDPRWILRPEVEPALRALTQLGLTFDALVKPAHLPHLCELAARHPDLAFVIDHAAKPRIPPRGERWEGLRDWSEHLRILARDSRAVVKLSGLATEAAPGWSAGDLVPYTDVLFEHFGPSRILWGSDWPVVDLAGGYAAWWSATRTLLESLEPEERDAVLGTNAARFYGLAVTVPGPTRSRGSPPSRP